MAGLWARYKAKRQQKAEAKAAAKVQAKSRPENTAQAKASSTAEEYPGLSKLRYPEGWTPEQKAEKRQKTIEMIEKGRKEAVDLPERIKRAVAHKPFAEACRRAKVDPGKMFRYYFTQDKVYAIHEFEAAMDAKAAKQKFSRTGFCVKYIMENVLPKLKKQ
jgi:hypothetical protein